MAMEFDSHYVSLPIQIFLKTEDETGTLSFVEIPLPFYVKYAKKSNNTRKQNSYNSLKSMYVNCDNDVSLSTNQCDYNHVLSVLKDEIASLIEANTTADNQNDDVDSAGECKPGIEDDEKSEDSISIQSEVDYDVADDIKEEVNDDIPGELFVDESCLGDSDVITVKIEENGRLQRRRKKRKLKLRKQHVNVYKCEDCNMSYKNSSGLQRHKRYLCSALPPDVLKQNKKRRTCSECGKCFLFKHVLENHMTVKHMRIKPYKCNLCEKAYYTRTSLALHVDSIHTSGYNHICEQCGKGFKTTDAIRHHIRTVHVVADLQCPVCPAKVKSTSNLRSHMKIHQMREKPFMCDICSKSFTEACRLRRHMGVHSGVKDNVCSECGKTFLAAYNLRVHMRIHSGEKPYRCDNCQRCFSQSVGLKVHICREGKRVSKRGRSPADRDQIQEVENKPDQTHTGGNNYAGKHKFDSFDIPAPYSADFSSNPSIATKNSQVIATPSKITPVASGCVEISPSLSRGMQMRSLTEGSDIQPVDYTLETVGTHAYQSYLAPQSHMGHAMSLPGMHSSYMY